MSFAAEQAQRIDAQLDRIQLQSHASEFSVSNHSTDGHPSPPSQRVQELQYLIKTLSVDASSRHPLLPASSVKTYLDRADLSSLDLKGQSTSPLQDIDAYEQELSWLLVAKATTHVYALVLDRILQQTVSLSNEIYYWDTVLSQRRWIALYSAQTSPLRLWDWSWAVWEDVRERAEGFKLSEAGEEVGQQWRQFYTLVRQAVTDRSIRDMQKHVVSPVARIRSEIRQKQARLKQARLRGANALGVLLGEGLSNECGHNDGLATPKDADVGGRRWKSTMARNVGLLDAVLAKTNDVDLDVDKFDSAIARQNDDDHLWIGTVQVRTDGDMDGPIIRSSDVATRLSSLVTDGIQAYDLSARSLRATHGRPSRLIRYWLPVTAGVLSSSTLLRILVNRQAEILAWIQDFGSTVMDFWANWVVEPTRKVIKTIRHDEGSEVSIMSKRSLEGDRDSLERMVIEFAKDNPVNATGSGNALTDVEIKEIGAKVREGDLTPVLRAYEKDLASPFMGAVRGNLVRALLIQVQKTKVDVEVAMGGIDALLKSQELVFGFVGLTPGILVTVAIWRWFRASFSEKQGEDRQRKQGVMVRQLRNIDRVLSNSTPTDFGELYYKDHGLLLCEAHVLRQEARRSMPDVIYREFVDEVDELVDVRNGVKRQRSVVERMRWAYARWF